MKWRTIILFMFPVISFVGCSLVDEDVSDCETDYSIKYELNLVTNLNIELNTQLALATEVEVKSALREYMGKVFTDKAHDVDLSYYDVNEHPVRLHHEHHIIDASQSSYTLYLPVREYMHLAVANIENSGSVTIEEDELCNSARLHQQVGSVVRSQASGLFTARLPMEVREGTDQSFDVHMYMANCASALVLDTLGSHIKDIKVYATGFATEMNLVDSTYSFAYDPRIEADRVDGADGRHLCFTTVSFPSREADNTKVTIETEDPFISEASSESLWFYYIYTVLNDNSVTETKLGVRLPLRAGQLKVIKGSILENGSVVPKEPYVGASVALDWSDGPSWEVDF